ncbi:sulfurtransferase [Campylobacterota bacterium DY0563]
MKKRYALIPLLLFITTFLNGVNLRVSPETLSKDLTSFKIIDVREKENYQKSHIKNALNFPAQLSYENTNLDGKVTNPNTIQKLLRNLGLNIEDNLVIYDEGSFFNAARVFWTFEVYGFKNVKLLNAGFKEWESKNFPTSKEIPNIKPSQYIASVNNNRLSTKFTTQIATKNPQQVIIDARSYEAYIGEKSVAQRFGHIPKAIHIPAIHNLSKEESVMKLKNTQSLKDLYKNIEADKKVVIYCAIGKVAATNYFALRELGYDVSNYDASWKEWGNDFSLPIENKSKQ